MAKGNQLRRRRIVSSLGLSLVLSATAFAAMPANASPLTASPGSTTQGGNSNYFLESGSGWVVLNPADETTDGGTTFYPTGPISDSTLVVIPNADGSLPGGMSVTQLKAVVKLRQSTTSANAAGWVVRDGVVSRVLKNGTISREASIKAANVPLVGAAPQAFANYAYSGVGTSYSSYFNGQTAFIGTTSSAKIPYSFDVESETAQVNAGEGKGWYTGYSGSTFGKFSKAYGLGSADDSTEGGASVPWGNTEDVGSFKDKCAKSTVCSGYWGY